MAPGTSGTSMLARSCGAGHQALSESCSDGSCAVKDLRHWNLFCFSRASSYDMTNPRTFKPRCQFSLGSLKPDTKTADLQSLSSSPIFPGFRSSLLRFIMFIGLKLKKHGMIFSQHIG